MTSSESKLEKVRQALADYMYSEGCSCCRNEEKHTAAKKVLAELLDVPAYSDGSGYDFYQFKTGGLGSKKTHKPFVTITHGLRGYFAVLLTWNPEYGGFYEPWQTGFGSYKTPEEAITEAKQMAESEGVNFVERKEK